ncbi:hypothetical protein ACFQX7_11255 [Luedemannella flava]
MWQPRFAYTSALVILVALALVSLPIWLVFYRMADSDANNGAGPNVGDLIALSMMLLGGLVTAGATWVIIIEMRGRVRMVDRLARTSERDLRPADLDLAALGAAPSDEVTQIIPGLPAEPSDDADGTDDRDETGGDETVPARGTAHIPVATAPVTAIPAPASSVPATLEASGHLLHSFSRVLRAFSQLPAQVAMLAVALSLFVGATLLSMR